MRQHRRWAIPLGLLVIALTAISTVAGGHVGVGTAGKPLVAAIGLACYAVAGLVFLLRELPERALVALLLVMGLAITLVHYADPDGPVVGLYLVVAYSPLRLPARVAGAVSAVAVGMFDVGILLDSADAVVFALVVTGGAVFFYLFGTLLVREEVQRLRADQLLVDLQASRAAELESAALAERARIAREMHDVLAHTLSGLALRLEGLCLATANQPVDPDFSRRLTGAAGLARDGLAEARAAVSLLHDGPMPGIDQLPALIDAHNAAGETARLTTAGTAAAVHRDTGLALYRAVQEGLSNARKHSPGAVTVVHLRWEPGRVELSIDSTGSIPASSSIPMETHPSGGQGLSGIADRVRLLGGTVEAGPTADGFRIHVTVPTTSAVPSGISVPASASPSKSR